MKNDFDAQEAKKLYNRHAEDYFDDQNKYPVINFLRNQVNALIGNPKGKKILYAGCGDAEEAKFAIENGAEVTGIDISEKCIKLAKNKFPKQQFKVMDFENTDFRANEFDIVVVIFAVMYKKSLKAVFKELERLTGKNGKIIIAVPHPVRKMVKYNQMDYFARGYRKENWKGHERFNYYRLIEDYVNELSGTGLYLDKLYEPKVPRKNEESPQMEIKHPHHLILVIKKLPKK